MAESHDLIRAVAEREAGALRHEFEEYSLHDLESSGRVMLVPKGELEHVLYLIEGRLIIDDYLSPEEREELGGF